LNIFHHYDVKDDIVLTMIRPLKSPLLVLGTVACVLSSCSSTSKVVSGMKMPKIKAPNFKMPKLKKPNFSKIALLNPKNFSLADLRAGKRVPIVQVRENDLKVQKTGQQLYLAYNRKKKSYGYYSADGEVFTPIDFDPGNLPSGSDGDLPSYGLLPALVEGGASGIAPGGKSKDLPANDLPAIPRDLEQTEDFGIPGQTSKLVDAADADFPDTAAPAPKKSPAKE